MPIPGSGSGANSRVYTAGSGTNTRVYTAGSGANTSVYTAGSGTNTSVYTAGSGANTRVHTAESGANTRVHTAGSGADTMVYTAVIYMPRVARNNFPLTIATCHLSLATRQQTNHSQLTTSLLSPSASMETCSTDSRGFLGISGSLEERRSPIGSCCVCVRIDK